MKKTILPALAMLIISAVMLSTASYAWFAMSTSVSADNMTVSIKSDSSYLLISNAAFTTTAEAKTSVDFGDDATPLLPVTFDDADTLVYNNFNVGGIWYDRVAANSSESTAPEKIDGEDNINYITTENLGKYVYKQTVYIAVSQESNALGALRVSGVKFNTAGGTVERDAINVVVVSSYNGESKYQRFCADDVEAAELTKSWGTINSGTALASSVPTCGTGNIKVDIYIFFNGDHDSIFTDNLTTLNGDASISVTFTADPAPAN